MKILFQGDSVTDALRKRDDYYDLGQGFPPIVARELKAIYPDIEFEFINKACGGHRTDNLIARWQEDTIDINPDIMTLMVGVNDCWHYVIGEYEYVSDETFEKNYRWLLETTKEKTNAKLIILESYVMEYQEHHFRPELLKKIEIIRKLALEYADYYIPLDGLFTAARVTDKETQFTLDGVHPSPEGHELIAAYVTDAICDIIDGE